MMLGVVQRAAQGLLAWRVVEAAMVSSRKTARGLKIPTMVQRDQMASFEVRTAQRTYWNVVERGVLKRVREFIPAQAGKCFVVTTADVWRLHGAALEAQLAGRDHQILLFAGGEKNKRISHVEALAEEMMEHGADRTSLVIGFGGGIVTDISGFLAAIFMRGIPVLQIPTTLLAQVDAATGGKTGVNLTIGKNLVGSFHQPLAVLIDPEVLATLPAREYRAGLFEVLKCGIIRDRRLFEMLAERSRDVLALKPEVVDELIAGAVQIKAEVVTADEREGDLRRILNFGHTIGHAIEAETEFVRMLHGEAVAWGMLAATRLAVLWGSLEERSAQKIAAAIDIYGPLPEVKDISPDRLLGRLGSDKKTLQGKVHFVLPTEIGAVKVVAGIDPAMVRTAITDAFASVQ
jgi:3-dehydroquinate synthase